MDPKKSTTNYAAKAHTKKLLAAIEKLSKGKILNGLAAAITTINYKHLDHVAELADKYHANFVWYNHLVPSGRAKATMDLTPTPEQYEWVLNHIWDITEKYRGKFEVHVHCPHFARVVKQRHPGKRVQRMVRKGIPWQMHLLRIRRLPQRNRKRRLNPLLLHRSATFGAHDAGKHTQQKPKHRMGRNQGIQILQQIPRPKRPQRQMRRLRVP